MAHCKCRHNRTDHGRTGRIDRAADAGLAVPATFVLLQESHDLLGDGHSGSLSRLVRQVNCCPYLANILPRYLFERIRSVGEYLGMVSLRSDQTGERTARIDARSQAADG